MSVNGSASKPQFLVPKDASVGATKRLANEWTRYNGAEAPTRKVFECELVSRNLYRWKVKIKNSFPEPLSTQLVLYASQFDVNDIILELQFDGTYPMAPPRLRLVEPRFLPFTIPSLGAGGVFESPLLREGGDWSPISTIHTCVTEIVSKISAACIGKDENFEFLDPSTRSPYSSAEAQSQRTGFIQHYRVMSVDDIGTEMGGKMALPASALEEITRSSIPEFPLIFEIKQTRASHESLPYDDYSSHSLSNLNLSESTTHETNFSNSNSSSSLSHPNQHHLKRTYAGVSTFDSVDGYALIPSWILRNCKISDGDVICARMVSLPKGDLVTLQPHDPAAFLGLSQPKEALESVLRSYVALQTNDLLHVAFDRTLYHFTVIKTLPEHAIDIRDTDLRLEIQMPPEFQPEKVSPSYFDPHASESSTSTSSPIGSTLISHILSNDTPLSEEDATTCSNCRKQIPKRVQATHEAFCIRNNFVCGLCDRVIRIQDKDAHLEEIHRQIRCSCGEPMEFRFLASHKQENCLHRLKPCQYCKLRKKMVEIPDHEDYCGSRTEKCSKCSKFISIKDFQQHSQSNCQFPPLPEDTGLFAKIKSFFATATEGP